jgi:hypothetical protein
MSMEVPGLSLEDKLSYLQDANEQLQIAAANKNRWITWVSEELREKIGEPVPLRGFVTSVSLKSGEGTDTEHWTTVPAARLADETRGWWLQPYNYTVCDVGNGSVRLSFVGQENQKRFTVAVDTISFVTPEQIAETEAIFEQQRQEQTASAI